MSLCILSLVSCCHHIFSVDTRGGLCGTIEKISEGMGMPSLPILITDRRLSCENEFVHIVCICCRLNEVDLLVHLCAQNTFSVFHKRKYVFLIVSISCYVANS